MIKSFLSILVPERAHNHTKTEHLPKVLPKMFYLVQFNHIKCLVPNCPGAKLSGAKLSVFIMLVPNCPGAKLSSAKLSWCQIVLVPNCPGQIVLPNCPGAKLSAFIILVPNCPLLLSWCQIVRFIILVPNCPVPNCPVLNCPTIV